MVMEWNAIPAFSVTKKHLILLCNKILNSFEKHELIGRYDDGNVRSFSGFSIKII